MVKFSNESVNYFENSHTDCEVIISTNLNTCDDKRRMIMNI